MGEKKAKKIKKEDEAAVEEENPLLGPKPSVYDTIPFQLYELGKYCLQTAPTVPDQIKEMYADYQARKEEERERGDGGGTEAKRRKEGLEERRKSQTENS